MGTFRPDGTVEAFTVDQTQIIGRGEWLRTGDREFSVAFVAVLRDDKGNPTLGGRVKGTLKIGDNADEAAGQNKFEVLDVTGKLIFTANYRARAVRVRAN